MNTSSTRTIRALSLAAITTIAFSPFVKAADANPKQPQPATAAATPAQQPSNSAKASQPAPSAPKPAPVVAPAPTPPAASSASDAKDEREFYSKAPIRLEEVEVSDVRPTAITQAPTGSSLDIYQPQSVIDLPFISNHLTPTADYSTIATLSPSVSNVTTNGAGLNDAKRLTVRSFNDGQFNVTYDGIPFADTNDFTHHTSSYFPAKMIGRLTVDRGPGTASTVGEATFGGTIALLSKDPRSDFAFIPTFSVGSNSTFLGHLEGNSGSIKALGGASAIASYQYLQTDGYLTNAKMERDTTYVKYLQPVGKNTMVSFLSNYNMIKFNNPVPVTQTQIDTYGRNYGLSDDPTRTDYWGYNRRKNYTDFEYIGIDTTVANDWHINAKGYTYYYGNRSYDTASIVTSTSASNAYHYLDLIGRYKLSAYRAWGETLNVSWDNAFGVLKFGGWREYQRSKRIQYGLNYSKGGAYDFNPTAAAGYRAAYFYDMVNYLDATQLFAEYDWRVSKSLTINGGLKNISFERQLDADINQTTRTMLVFNKKSTKTVGSVSANYSVTNEWTTYVQAAQGYLAPNLNQFYVPNPANNRVDPQTTMNYQVGTVYKNDRLNADFDVYQIDYKNFPRTTLDLTTGQNIVVMAKGAKMHGVEAEATYAIGGGLSLYVNGSINNAKYKESNLDLDMVAQKTAAVGLILDRSGLFGSIVDKYVGQSKIYASASGFNPDDASTLTTTGISKGYHMTDAAIGYGMKFDKGFIKNAKIKLEINNVLDKKVQVMDSFSGGTNISNILYNVLPTRNYFLTLSTEF
ncbi:MAG: TonB-dependent receptor [Nibricoccus sp.]